MNASKLGPLGAGKIERNFYSFALAQRGVGDSLGSRLVLIFYNQSGKHTQSRIGDEGFSGPKRPPGSQTDKFGAKSGDRKQASNLMEDNLSVHIGLEGSTRPRRMKSDEAEGNDFGVLRRKLRRDEESPIERTYEEMDFVHANEWSESILFGATRAPCHFVQKEI